MRTTVLLMTVFFASTLFAQQTTETEYKYIKTGIKTTIESGLDVKAGYLLRDITTGQKHTNAILDAKLLLRKSNNTPAGTYVKIIVSGTFSGDGTYYFCIPSPNYSSGDSYGWSEFYTDLDKAGNTAKSALVKWMAYQYSRGVQYLKFEN